MKRAFRLACVALLVLIGLACRGLTVRAPRVLVLGFDGMDPVLLKQFIDDGKLPNFSKLARNGSFLPLGTTNPPQSPVAWSTFITGLDPMEHGVFDFLHRDPKQMKPIASLNTVAEGEFKLLREGTPFWRRLEEAGIPAKLVKLPAAFPALEQSGTYLTDMGTPDLEGTYGYYSYYTDGLIPATSSARTEGRRVQVEARDGIIKASLVGPSVDGDTDSVPFQVALDSANDSALLSVQEQMVLLKPGEWSEWLPVSYPHAQGMVRVYLQSLKPFALYVSPPNADPGEPAFPVSYPKRYSRILSQDCGRFYTQGMPEEVGALMDGLFSDQEFLQQNRLVVDERKRLFASELSKFHEGLFFFYVSSTDILSHLYWNTIDPDHPGYDQKRAEKYRKVIFSSYQLADEFLGQAMQVAGDDPIVVLSDHGFASFRRAFNLNLWLRENGYQKAHGERMAEIDWAHTKAYAVGFNGLYLNLREREAKGVVEPAQRQALLEEIAGKLTAIRDPVNGRQVIVKAQVLPQPQDPRLRNQSPDLLVGYSRDYRASWETALGDVGKALLTDNKQDWSGDHLMSPDQVPGVLLSNRPIKEQRPQLHDLAPSLLRLYGLDPDPAWPGRSIW